MGNDRHDPTIHWIEPRRRGVLPLDRFHQPRSLRRLIRRGRFEIRVDRAFPEVIEACAEPRPERPRTWLNDELIALYCALHRQGHAHSVELVGGTAGRRRVRRLARRRVLRREHVLAPARCQQGRPGRPGRTAPARGYALLDTQFVTDHLRQFGAIEIPRETYQLELRRALEMPAAFQGEPSSDTSPSTAGGATGSSQSITQTSYTGCSSAETAGLEANIQPLNRSTGAPVHPRPAAAPGSRGTRRSPAARSAASRDSCGRRSRACRRGRDAEPRPDRRDRAVTLSRPWAARS